MIGPLSAADVALSRRPGTLATDPRIMRCPVSGGVVGRWRGAMVWADPCENALAHGAPLALVMGLAARRAEMGEIHESGPISTLPTQRC